MSLMFKIFSTRYASLLLSVILFTCLFSGFANLSASDLKPRIKVRDASVYLSDIFTDIELDADKEVLTAPLPGQSKNVSTTTLWNIAKANGIQWQRPRSIKHIRIMREGQPVNLAALQVLLVREVKARGISDDIQVSLFGINRNLYLPVNSDVSEIEIDSLTLSSTQDRYRAELLWPLGDGSYKEIALNGTIDRVRLVPMLNRTLVPGDIISRDDIDWVNMSVKRITSNTIQSTDNFIGFTPRRAITANKPLRKSDVEALRSVSRGNQVMISYVSGPMVLSTTGKALQHGAIGDSIRILNLTSNKTIYAKIVGPDQVEIVRLSRNRKLASR